MTTLFRPVLIESAEQAEALPEGSVLWQQKPHGLRYGYVTAGEHSRWLGPFPEVPELDDGVTVHALVPIEAEEQWGLMDADGTTYRAGSREHAQRWQQAIGTPLARRLVTPWEEA